MPFEVSCLFCISVYHKVVVSVYLLMGGLGEEVYYMNVSSGFSCLSNFRAFGNNIYAENVKRAEKKEYTIYWISY